MTTSQKKETWRHDTDTFGYLHADLLAKQDYFSAFILNNSLKRYLTDLQKLLVTNDKILLSADKDNKHPVFTQEGTFLGFEDGLSTTVVTADAFSKENLRKLANALHQEYATAEAICTSGSKKNFVFNEELAIKTHLSNAAWLVVSEVAYDYTLPYVLQFIVNILRNKREPL